MYVVSVQFTIAPDQVEEFEKAILANATASVSNEPGCLQFDVSFNENGTQCFLYEVYTDESAFADHRASAHFAACGAAIEGKVISRRFETYQLVNHGNRK